jgi:hypothetical protein
MASGVTGPNDKVDVAFEILLYPAECFVYEGGRRVAVTPFCSKVPCGAFTPMTRIILVYGFSGFVVRIWM